MRFWNAHNYGGAPPYDGVNPPISMENEAGFLREQANYFQKALDDINNRLNELEETKGE